MNESGSSTAWDVETSCPSAPSEGMGDRVSLPWAIILKTHRTEFLCHLDSQTRCLPRPSVTPHASYPESAGHFRVWPGVLLFPLTDHSLSPTCTRQFPCSTYRGFSSSYNPQGQVRVLPQHCDPQLIYLTQNNVGGVSKLWKAPPQPSPEPRGLPCTSH